MPTENLFLSYSKQPSKFLSPTNNTHRRPAEQPTKNATIDESDTCPISIQSCLLSFSTRIFSYTNISLSRLFIVLPSQTKHFCLRGNACRHSYKSSNYPFFSNILYSLFVQNHSTPSQFLFHLSTLYTVVVQ